MKEFLWFAATATGGLALVWLSLRPLRGLGRGRRAALAALRSATVLAAAAAAAGPVWTVRRATVAPAPVIVALDNSASMAIPDCEGGNSRARVVVKRLLAPGGLLDRWAAGRDVEVYAFGELLVPLARRELSASDDVTDFHAALRQLKAEARRVGAAAVVLVSDGVDSRGLRPAEAAAAAAGLPPVYAVVVGGSRRLDNTAIVAVDCPRRVQAGKAVDVVVTVVGPVGGRVKVRWSVSDGQRGEVLAELGQTGQARATARLVPRRPGPQRLEVRLVGDGRDLLPADDSAVVALEVVPAERRLVYLAGAPSPEVAALRRLLARIEGLEVTVAVKKAPGDGWWQELPRLKRLGGIGQAVGSADAVAYIIGNVAEKDLPAQAWRTIARRVRAGEAAVCVVGGPKSGKLPDAIQELLPARVGPVQPRAAHVARPSGGGLELRGELWQGLPALAEVNALGPLARGARIVAKTTDGAGLVAVREDGQVRSAAVATDTLFRWQFSAAATEQSRAAYEDFWLKMVAWLTRPRPPRALTLMPDKLTALKGEPIILEAQAAASAERVEVEAVEGGKVAKRVKLRREAPGVFRGEVPALKPGGWILRGRAYDSGRVIGTDEVAVETVGRSREFRWPQPDEAVVEAIAQATGGRVVRWEEVERLPEMWPKQKRRRETARRIDPARGVGAGVVMIILLAADWMLRRRWGMV